MSLCCIIVGVIKDLHFDPSSKNDKIKKKTFFIDPEPLRLNQLIGIVFGRCLMREWRSENRHNRPAKLLTHVVKI